MPRTAKLHELPPLIRIHAINRLALVGKINRDAAKALVELAKLELDANRVQDNADFLNARRSGRMMQYRPVDRYAAFPAPPGVNRDDPGQMAYFAAVREQKMKELANGHGTKGK